MTTSCEIEQLSQDLKKKMHCELLKIHAKTVDEAISQIITNVLKKTEEQVIENIEKQASHEMRETEKDTLCSKIQDGKVAIPAASNNSHQVDQLSQNEWVSSGCIVL